MPVIEDERAEARRLRDHEDKSEREIAMALGRAPSTIHSWLQETPPADDPPPLPGQQTIDGGEVPPVSQNGNGPHIEEIRVDGTTQLGLIDFGGKKPQTGTVTLTGGAFELLEGRGFMKGDRIHFAGEAVVFDVGGRDKIDGKTGIVVSASQRHSARIADALFTDGDAALVRALFRKCVAADRQKAAALADDLVRASGE